MYEIGMYEIGNEYEMSGEDDWVAGAGGDLERLLAVAGASPALIGKARHAHPAQRAAMMQALANRRAQQGLMLQSREPQHAREVPLGFEATADTAAAAAFTVQNQPQIPFRVERLFVPSDIAGLFTLSDVRVGVISQFGGVGNVPARAFQENSVGCRLKGDTAQISQTISIQGTNISGAAARFRAMIVGAAVR